MADHSAEKDAPTCDHCGGGATHEGYAYPAGGSFPVTGCERCLEGLAQDMDVRVRPIQGGSVCTCGHTVVAHVRSGPCRLCSCNDTRPIPPAKSLCVRCEGDRVVALTSAHEPGGYGPCPDCQRPIPPGTGGADD